MNTHIATRTLLIGSVIVAVLAIGGALLVQSFAPLYESDVYAEPVLDGREKPYVAPDTTTTTLQQQGSSSDVDAIESDLQATSLTNLDAEVGVIEGDLPETQVP